VIFPALIRLFLFFYAVP